MPRMDSWRAPYELFPPHTAVWGLVGSWLIWLLVVIICVATTTPAVIPEVVVGTSLVPLVVFIGLWLYYQAPIEDNDTKKPVYSHNLGNTVITLLAVIIGFPVLYTVVWYPDRIRSVIEYTEDTVDEVSFPSLTIFQRNDWASQAILDSPAGKCFIGWPDVGSPDCAEASEPSTSCQCSGNWAAEIEDFVWHNNTYRAQTLRSTTGMMSKMPTTQMITQTSFFYNSSNSRGDLTLTLAPSLWIAIYDPDLGLQEALESGYTRMHLINANGMTAITLGLYYREALEKSPAYDYGITISTIPASSMDCDVALDPQAPACTLSLFLQYSTFDRHVFKQSVALTLGPLVTEAGAWFALFQLAGWLLSGLALHAA